VSQYNTYIEHSLTKGPGRMPAKAGLRPNAGTAAVLSATFLSGGLPIQDTVAPVAPTSQTSEVFSEVELQT
jgi:hypothetical protein